jgi:hypothetical protein
MTSAPNPYRTALNAAIANLIMVRDAAERKSLKAKVVENRFHLLGQRQAFQESINAIQVELDRADKVSGL